MRSTNGDLTVPGQAGRLEAPRSAEAAAPVRVSDEERERTVALLREHWSVGRLTLTELEARAAEAYRAERVAELWHAVRELPVPVAAASASGRAGGAAVASLVLGVMGVCLFLFSFGLLFVLSTPLSAGAWVSGRRARRHGGGADLGRSLALAGEILGAVGAIGGCLAVTGCAVIIAAAA